MVNGCTQTIKYNMVLIDDVKNCINVDSGDAYLIRSATENIIMYEKILDILNFPYIIGNQAPYFPLLI